MKNTLKHAKKEADRQLKERQYKHDAENRIVVNMTVEDDTDFLSVFSANTTPVISSDVSEFIENSTNWIAPKEELTLHIHSNCIDEQEKVIYENAIKEYYTQKYIVNEQELKRNRFLASLLFVAGIGVLAFEIIFDYVVGNIIWTEVIDIAAWVLLWEATDISIFQNRSLRLKKKRYLSYLSMKIEYSSLD